MGTLGKILLTVGLMATFTQAQVHLVTGQIAIVGQSTNTVELMAPGGGSTIVLAPALGSFGRAILWDPSQPDSFLIAGTNSNGTGFLQRMTMTSPTMVTQTTIVAAAATFRDCRQLSWGQTPGTVVIADSYFDHVVSVTLATGTVTPITTGSVLWANLRSAAVDPRTGDIYAGDNGGTIYHIDAATSAISVFQSGFGDSVEKILFDASHASSPTAGPYYLVCVLVGGSLHRIDLTSPPNVIESVFSNGSLYPLNSFDIDHNGDFVLGYQQNVIGRVANPLVIPSTPVLNVLGSGSNNTHWDCAVVGGSRPPFQLSIQTLPNIAVFDVRNWPTGTTEGWLLPTAVSTFPLGQGPFFGLYPDFTTLFVFGLPASPNSFLHFPIGASGVPLKPNGTPIFPQTLIGTAGLSGQMWDATVIALAGSTFAAQTNVARFMW